MLSRNLRQPEVENLGVTALGDKDVRRLDVAVDDSLSMRGIEGIGNFDGERENHFRFQRMPADAVLQRHAVEILHDDEGLTFAFVNLEDHADVRVVQGRRRLRLTLEAGQSLRVPGDLIGEKFQGDEAMQLDIFSFVDDTHPPAAESFDDAIVGDGLADHSRKNLTLATSPSQRKRAASWRLLKRETAVLTGSSGRRLQSSNSLLNSDAHV